MIHDSYPWKRQLARDADIIERWSIKPSYSERRSILIEKKIFLAAYTIRKLGDAAKISSQLLTASISVSRFPPKRTGYSQLNSHRFDQFFDLEKPARVSLPRRRLMDLLIHSLVFVEVQGKADTFESFMVTSDYERLKGLVQVKVAAFIDLMRLAANDCPAVIKRTRDKKTGEWQTWAGHDEPSSE